MADSKPKPNWYPPWAPRFWSGMRMGHYFQLLRENRFQIHPSKYPMTALVGGCSAFNSALGAIQSLTMGKRVNETRIEHPPIFIIGHWRSGTTLMHELLALDDQFAYPTNFDAFVPNHFLISRHFVYPVVSLLMPKKRPMDDMAMGAATPQEDDFALCAYGAPTPYRRIAFPNRTNRYHLQLNLSLSDANERMELQKALEHFLKSLTIRYSSKQLVLKSPPHTGRLKQLAQWFPQAKFVHMARDPLKVVPSTMRLWKLLDSLQGFQVPKYDDSWLKNHIFECQDLMYQAYFAQRAEIPKNQLVEVNFESLVESPVDVMKTVYEQLELDGFDSAETKVNDYFAKRKAHKTNPSTIDDSMAEDIKHHWREYIEEFGYDKKEAKSA
jgi:hypothetical protein